MKTIIELFPSLADIAIMLAGWFTASSYKMFDDWRHHKEGFSPRVWFFENWPRFAMSLVASFGLLTALPESVESVMTYFGWPQIEWNTLASFLVGALGLQLFILLMNVSKSKLRKHEKPNS